jgi:histidyl-tRNA synthetase
MKIQPVKGTRDFYPPDMAVHNYIVDGWKKVSLRNGFEEYDGPIFEYLKMFQIKSGDEIVEQLFSLTDRGGRDLALRPEMTPTLARMVNQRINSLPRPIKWFSIPRLFRAERPQKGRLREFFQWNIDIIGEDSVLADAEVIFTTIDYLREVGLSPQDIVVKVSSRKILKGVMNSIGIPDEKIQPLYALLDKKNKLPFDTFEKTLNDLIPDSKMANEVKEFTWCENIQQIENRYGRQGTPEILDLMHLLYDMGAGEYFLFDPGIVRGLAYYTGIVFEIYDKADELRAICGGGRYDNLLADFGGPSISATGMGMGDCVLEILLGEKGLLDKQVPKRHLEYFVISTCDVDEEAEEEAEKKTYQIIAKLRSTGHSANFSYKMGSLSKQLKEASAQNAENCIIIGEQELRENKITVKDMATGKQDLRGYDEFLSGLESAKGI